MIDNLEHGWIVAKDEDEGEGGEEFMSLSFGYVKGAYPYLTNFFRNEVSLTIRINALLSVVALQLNDLDVSAANGDGISMALDIPTKVEYNFTGNEDDTVRYTYSYSDRNNLVDAAQGVIDDMTNTLSIQRTQNEAQYVNFVISVDTKDGNTSDENGNVYADVATRLVSRLCAPMLGTETHPYLVATQKDFEHVGMTSAELSAVPSDPAYKMYTQWATPILENGTPTEGVVNFRLMGYVPLTDYSREPIADLTNESYTLAHNGNSYNVAYKGISFDGNGYSEEWKTEAARRGLSNYPSTAEAQNYLASLCKKMRSISTPDINASLQSLIPAQF